MRAAHYVFAGLSSETIEAIRTAQQERGAACHFKHLASLIPPQPLHILKKKKKKCPLKINERIQNMFRISEKLRIILCRKCSARGRLGSNLENVNLQRLANSELKPLPHTELPYTCVYSLRMPCRIQEFSFSPFSENHIPAVCNASLEERRAVWRRTLADLD